MDRRGFVATGIGGLLLMGLGTSTQQKFSQFLRLAFFRSVNYVAGVSGWTVNQDGSAEFNNLTIRGTFFGTDFEINSLGAFFYSGPPALGNLIASIAPAAGADDGHGNAFQAGIVSYTSGTDYVQILASKIGFVNGTNNGSAQLVSDGLLFGGITPGQRYYFDKEIAALDPGTGNSFENWHPVVGGPGFASAQWSNAPAPARACAFKMLPDGGVALRGRARFTSNGVTGLTNPTSVFTLPGGWDGDGTTLADIPVPIYGAPAIAANRIPSLVVNQAGAGIIQIFNVTSSTVNGTTVDVPLDGIFRFN